MGGTTSGSGSGSGGGGGGGGGGGCFPSCDSEEFSALFNQLLSPPPEMDPNNNHSGSGYPQPAMPNWVVPSSSSVSSESTFHFSSRDDDPFVDHHNDALIPAPPSHSDASTKQHPITCPVENGEASELPSKPAPPPRTSSKRSRAAEFHNLSEKRRRSRINKKMKALQNLIPNSNKTDKASILDETIEYLKQLQLQVQTLMMRNGLTLHRMSLPGGLKPVILPLNSLNFDEGNGFQNSISGIASSSNDESLVRPSFNFPKQCSISNQSVAIPSVINIATSDTSSSFQHFNKDAHCGSVP